MIESSIFNVITDNDEIRTIENIYCTSDLEDSNSIDSIIFKINNKYWIIGVDPEFDEIEFFITPNLNADFIRRRNLDVLSYLKDLEIGTMSAIVNEKGYTNGLKIRILDHTSSRKSSDPYFCMLTIISASNLKFEITKTGIDRYLV